jgi:hypothetical protein
MSGARSGFQLVFLLLLATSGCPGHGFSAPHQPGRPSGDGIRIVSATYGGNCGVAYGNVSSDIARACNGR